MMTEHGFETIMRMLNTGHCAEQVRQKVETVWVWR